MSIGKFLKFKRFFCSCLRQNFSIECEKALNKQIGLELSSSYAYLAMAYHFHNIALNGAYKFFKEASQEENDHAQKIMEYINKRGGKIILTDIQAPKNEYGSLLDAMKQSLIMEQTLNEALIQLHGLASKENDPNLCDFLETNYLQEQVDAQKTIADYITKLERSCNDVGTFIFDLELEKASKMH